MNNQMDIIGCDWIPNETHMGHESAIILLQL